MTLRRLSATLLLALLAMLLLVSSGNTVHSASRRLPQLSYTPEPYITLTMYALTSGGGIRQDLKDPTCDPSTANNTLWGCSAFCNNPEEDYKQVCNSDDVYPYPYPSNFITVPVQTYYLLDVVSQEMAPDVYTHPASLRAQAVAARSYVWWQIENLILNPYYDIDSINNSAENYQVFIPYRFDKLNPRGAPLEPDIDTPCIAFRYRSASQERACEAIERRQYLAQWDVDAPAFASFNADMYAQTRTNPKQADPETRSYRHLIGVDDPISTACDSDNQGYYLDGMSQQGANRWVAGHECSYSYATPVPGNAPGGPWSVKWFTATQILFHYYTRVQLRDADNDNKIISPDWRWNPLLIDWGTPDNQPPVMIAGGSQSFKIQVQNTGIDTWDCDFAGGIPIPAQKYRLRYRWLSDGIVLATGEGISLCDLKPGASKLVGLPVQVPAGLSGLYTFRLDMYENSEHFWFSDGGWPPYDVPVQIIPPPNPTPTPTSCGNDC